MSIPIKFVMAVLLHLLVVLSLQIGLQSSFAQNFSKVIVNENSTLTQYEDPDLGIRLSYPSEWGNITETRAGCLKEPSCVLGLESKTGNPFGFALVKFSKETCNCNSLTDFVRNMYKTAGQNKGFSFINDNGTTVGKKYPSWQYAYSYLHDNAIAKALNVLTTNNETYFAFGISYPIELGSKILPEFKKVIDSIEFLPVQSPVTKIPSFMNKNQTEESIPETSIDNNPNGLQILSHNSFTDSIGYLHVVGEIKNNYPSTATFVKIVGTFYDVNNIVVGTQFTYANPSDIGSGQKAPFELILTSASVPTSLIDHYNLQATYQ